MFIVHDEQELIDTIKKVIDDPINIYKEKIQYLQEERNKIFSIYNIVRTLEMVDKLNETTRLVQIMPKNRFHLYKLRCKILNFYLRLIKLLR